MLPLHLYIFFVGTRESAFFYAISSAGVVYQITRACRRGDLKRCQCDPRKRGHDSEREFSWGGCSENVDYGSKFARRYMDARERNAKDARALMNVHNNHAGRKVSIDLTLISVCHFSALNGLCF